MERQRAEKEAREAEEAARKKRLDDQQKNQAFVREMMQALEHKRTQAELAKVEERRYNEECIKVQNLKFVFAPVG